MDNKNKIIGTNIKRIRNQKGLTQKELAKKAGIAEITIRKYELFKNQPRMKQLQKVANTLDVTVDELMSDVVYDSISNKPTYSDTDLQDEKELSGTALFYIGANLNPVEVYKNEKERLEEHRLFMSRVNFKTEKDEEDHKTLLNTKKINYVSSKL